MANLVKMMSMWEAYYDKKLAKYQKEPVNKETVDKIEKYITTEANARSVLAFASQMQLCKINSSKEPEKAKHVETLFKNLNKHMIKTSIEHGEFFLLAEYAAKVKSADKDAILNALIKAKTYYGLENYAIAVKDADMKKVTDGVIALDNPKSLVLFARYAPRNKLDLNRITDALIKSGDAKYIKDYFDKGLDTNNYKKLSEALTKLGVEINTDEEGVTTELSRFSSSNK